MVILIREMKKPFLKVFKREVYVSSWGNVSAREQVEMTSKGSSITGIWIGEDMRSLTPSISVPTVLKFHGSLAGDNYNVQNMI